MGFELPDGKTARNLQEQVKFLSEKLKDLYAAVNKIGIRVLVVDELPEEGEPATIYLVPAEDASQENIYNEYLWIEDEWELIGTTQIDLSDYMTLSTEQTISGKKTFSGDTYFTGNAHFQNTSYLSECYCYGSLYSAGTNDLGSSSYTWKDLYLSGKAIFSAGTNTYTIGGNEYNGLDIARSGATVMSFGGSDFSTYTHQPFSNNTYDLGSSSRAWKDLHLSGNTIYYNANSSITWSLRQNQYSNLEFAYNNIGLFSIGTSGFFPNSNNARDLGTSGLKWRNIYFSGNLSDGTNAVSVAQLASGLGGTYRHRITVEITSGFLEIAVNLNSSTAIDNNALFYGIVDHILGLAVSFYGNQTYGVAIIDSVDTTLGQITYSGLNNSYSTENIVRIVTDVVTQL